MVLWNFDLIWKNYGTMEKTMELERKLWYFGQNYGTIPKTMELQFMKGKHGKLSKKLLTLIYNGKNNGDIPKQLKFLNKYIS